MLTAIYDTIRGTMRDRGVGAQIVDGIDSVATEDDAPKVVFYPVRDRFDKAVMNPGGNPRTLVDRISYSNVRLWGLTIDHVDQLIEQVVSCVHVAMKKVLQESRRAGSYEIGDGTWITDTRTTNRGYEYDFQFGIRIPIIDRTWDGSYMAPPPREQETYKDIARTVSEVHSTVNDVQNSTTDQTVEIIDQ